MSNLHVLHKVGQSTWLNYMHRAFIQSGELRRCIEDGIQGVTANAAVFEKMIREQNDYDQAIRQEMVAGTRADRIHEALMVDDVQRAADILRPVYERSEGLDGFASLELNPALAHNAVDTVATARHVLAGIDRGNAMVEAPATVEGCEAVQTLTADGISLNATHIFAVSVFERVAQAYISGLESFLDSHSVWRIAPTAVASFSVGAIDEAVDAALAERERTDLGGKTGIAMVRLLCDRFHQIFRGPRWERLARQGGRVMRPKWTRIKPHGDAYPLTFYANALIGERTVMTFTPETLDAFREQDRIPETETPDLDAAQAHLHDLEAAGIDLDAITARLQEEHLAASVSQYKALIDSVSDKLYRLGQTR